MMKDIENRNDIVKVLRSFYQKAMPDGLIGHFFTEVVQLDIEEHVPVIADFWEAVLFDRTTYRKNVMEVHRNIDQISAIKKEHLDHWVQLFVQTVDENFKGTKAQLAKERAQSIATLMNFKFNHKGIGKI